MGRESKTKSNEGAHDVQKTYNTDSKSEAESQWNSDQADDSSWYGQNPYSGGVNNMDDNITWLNINEEDFETENDVFQYILDETRKRETAGVIYKGKALVGGWAPESYKASEWTPSEGHDWEPPTDKDYKELPKPEKIKKWQVAMTNQTLVM